MRELSLLEKIVGHIGEAATGLEHIYKAAEKDPSAVLEKAEFLRFVVSNLKKVELALARIQEDELEDAKSLLDEVWW